MTCRNLRVIVPFAIAAASLSSAACERIRGEDLAYVQTGADPERGRDALHEYGCLECHTIPGVRGASGRVGPSLARFQERAYVGGVVSNTPDHLVQWLLNPPAISPATAMPDVGVTEDDARDIAAFLYTVR